MSIIQAYQRIKMLSQYIINLAQNIDKQDMIKASKIIKTNKQKIDNNSFKFTHETKIINSLQKDNKKLKDQILTLRLKKQELKKQNIKRKQTIQKRYNTPLVKSGLTNQKVRIHMVRFKITLSDIQDMQFEQASLNLDFQHLFIFNYQYNNQKTLFFSDFLLIQKKNLHILLQYELQGQRRYLMIHCQDSNQALRIFRSLAFGKLIKQNQSRKKLFKQNYNRQSSKDLQFIFLNESVDQSTKQIQTIYQKYKKKQVQTQKISHKNQNINYLLTHLGYKNKYQYNNKVNNGQNKYKIRKDSQDFVIKKFNLQNLMGKDKNLEFQQKSFEQQTRSHSNPSSPLQKYQLQSQSQFVSPIYENNSNNQKNNQSNFKKIDYANFVVSQGIIKRKKQKQQLLQSFGLIEFQSQQHLQNLNFNHDIPNKKTIKKEPISSSKIQQKQDQYKSKSSLNNVIVQRNSQDSNISNYPASNSNSYSNSKSKSKSRSSSGNDFDLTNFQHSQLKNTNKQLQQSDYISQQSQYLQLSSPGFPKRVNYGNYQAYMNLQPQIKNHINVDQKKSSNNMINFKKIENEQLPSEKSYNLTSQKQSSSPLEEQQSGSQSDSQSQQFIQKFYFNGQDTSEQQQLSSTEQSRKVYLQSGLIMTKCSPNGFSPHQKKLYLSQNQVQIIYQDIKDKKKKTVSLKDIADVQYKKYYQGIKKHIKKSINENLCFVLKVKPCKATKNKYKNLQFYGKDKQAVEKYADYLKRFLNDNINIDKK